ncbi:uncharacterized protein [Pyxicephalus adspersus]
MTLSCTLSSQLIICLIFIIIPIIMMTENYIEQKPEYIYHTVGENASIQCTAGANIDIRNLSLLRRHTKIFTLRTSKSIISKVLKLSGSFEELTWSLSQLENFLYQCSSDKNQSDFKIPGSSVEPNTTTCSVPGDFSMNLSILNGSEKVVTLWMENRLDYHSRIQLSGTIRNLSIMLNNLQESDRDSYTCSGRAEGVVDDIKGKSTSLVVEQKSSYGMFAGITLGVIAVILVTLIIVIVIKRKRRMFTEVPMCCNNST